MFESRLLSRFAGSLVLMVLIAAACGDDGGEGNAVSPTSTQAPVTGGSLTMAMFSETLGLDPVVAFGSGVAGGTELSALYDTIMRYNPETEEYEPRTAESLTSNADATEWTLKLKPNITFRDGTPYDAAAVKLSFDRFTEARRPSHITLVRAVTVVDPLTVRFDLTQTWTGFPYLLADQPGMLVSPTALASLGDPEDPGYRDKKAAFNLNPVGAGAGPFEIVSFRPREAIVMKKNPNYWGGEVYLDELRFIVAGGAAQSYEALRANSVQAAILRNPAVVASAKAASFPGYAVATQAGGVLLINNGVEVTCKEGNPAPTCTGQPDGAKVAPYTATKDIRVRQAIAAAVDPEVINQRANDGKGLPGNELFQESFPYYPDVAGPTIDPDRARQLLQEAKADGYDGKVRILCTNTPERQALAAAVETMLRAVGFEVATTADIDTQAQVAEVFTKKDFDIACWGFSMPPDDGAVLAIRLNFLSTAATNRVGYKNAEMDAAIVAALAATTPDEKKDAYRRMAEIYTAEVPSLVFEGLPDYIAWRPNVHGVTPNQSLMVHFDKAWIGE